MPNANPGPTAQQPRKNALNQQNANHRAGGDKNRRYGFLHMRPTARERCCQETYQKRRSTQKTQGLHLVWKHYPRFCEIPNIETCGELNPLMPPSYCGLPISVFRLPIQTGTAVFGWRRSFGISI